MKRWNGWGDDTVIYHLPDNAQQFLEERVGETTPSQDTKFDEIIKGIPDSRLSAHPLITADPRERLIHARGQSFPDWVALRSGHIGQFPDGVAYPMTGDDVRALLQYAGETGAKLIPYGGGTSVVGHINPVTGDVPVLTVDMSRMNRLINLDDTSHLATFGAGISGPDLEAQLRARGYTLGHFPQSFEYSTLGGWIATRSSGQQSLHYGRIEQLFAGGVMETPVGQLDMPVFPASAAGPDLREIVLGSEGRMGIITEATIRISAQPENEQFHAVFFPDFESGMAAARQILQARIPLSMMRLSTARETETTLALAGREWIMSIVEGYLSIRGAKEQKSMLMFGFTGKKAIAGRAVKETLRIAGQFGGVHLGQIFGKEWAKSRFKTPYLRNSLWERGYAVDTLETATSWSNVPVLLAAIEKALQETMAEMDEKIHVFTHLSHLYPHGSSIYTTYVFRITPDSDELLNRWQKLKQAASQAIVQHGGTISHQHGVGYDHMPYLVAEKGETGMATLQNLVHHYDPSGVMNPDKLIQS